MYTLGRIKRIVVWGAIVAFCEIFYLVYDIFSHNVRSPYMTYLFMWPLVLGLVPNIVALIVSLIIKRDIYSGCVAVNAYCSGVATLTAASLLRGIFDIAGTSSAYQVWLMYVGIGMTVLGAILWIVGCVRRKQCR